MKRWIKFNTGDQEENGSQIVERDSEYSQTISVMIPDIFQDLSEVKAVFLEKGAEVKSIDNLETHPNGIMAELLVFISNQAPEKLTLMFTGKTWKSFDDKYSNPKEKSRTEPRVVSISDPEYFRRFQKPPQEKSDKTIQPKKFLFIFNRRKDLKPNPEPQIQQTVPAVTADTSIDGSTVAATVPETSASEFAVEKIQPENVPPDEFLKTVTVTNEVIVTEEVTKTTHSETLFYTAYVALTVINPRPQVSRRGKSQIKIFLPDNFGVIHNSKIKEKGASIIAPPVAEADAAKIWIRVNKNCQERELTLVLEGKKNGQETKIEYSIDVLWPETEKKIKVIYQPTGWINAQKIAAISLYTAAVAFFLASLINSGENTSDMWEGIGSWIIIWQIIGGLLISAFAISLAKKPLLVFLLCSLPLYILSFFSYESRPYLLIISIITFIFGLTCLIAQRKKPRRRRY